MKSTLFNNQICDLCLREEPIIPTGIGEWLGEKNPDLCDRCKGCLERLSEPTIKLIIHEINILSGQDK